MKNKIYTLLGLLTLTFTSTYAQSAGPLSPTVAVAVGSGANFVNLTGFFVPMDLSPAYTDLTDYPLCPNSTFCYYSKAAQVSGYSFNIPANASISGIVVNLRKQISNPIPNIKDSVVQLMKGGVPVGSNLKNNLQWPNLMTYVTYGDSSNLWGTTWTPADINSSNFGVNIVVQNTDFAQLAQIDHASIKVYYTLPNAINVLNKKSDVQLQIGSDFITLLNAQDYFGASINLYNLLGKQVIGLDKFQGESLPISSLKKGVYIMQIANNKGIVSKRITVN
jgi:Secretion system C-terminal sorting domain